MTEGEKQSMFSACELTVNCMSLSLLEVDLGKKALVAGKTDKPHSQHMRIYVCTKHIYTFFYLPCIYVPTASTV